MIYCIGVARIFDWGGVKPKITYNGIIRNFQEELFVGQKYPRMENQRPWPGLALNQGFA